MADTDPAYVNVGAMSPAEVFQRLFNAAGHTGATGHLHRVAGVRPKDMSIERAELLVREWKRAGNDLLYVDYYDGRALKVQIDERPLYIGLYDRDHGHGAAARALGLAD